MDNPEQRITDDVASLVAAVVTDFAGVITKRQLCSGVGMGEQTDLLDL